MSSGAWQCPECGERLEPEFSECWKCGHLKGLDTNEASPEQSDDEAAVAPVAPSDPMVCPNCNLTLDFVGTKKFHEGTRAAPFLLGEIGELFVKREHFDVYVCSRCGRIELFLDGVGEEFRPN